MVFRAFVLVVLRFSPQGSVVVWVVSVRAVSPVPAHIAVLAEAASASAPPQPELPWFTEGEVVEPRAVRGVAILSDAASPAASTAGWCEPRPRRSLRREREARELIALSKLVHDTRRLQRQVRDARRLQLLIALVAAVRRAGLVG